MTEVLSLEKLNYFFCTCVWIFITSKTQSSGRINSVGKRLLDFEKVLWAKSVFYSCLYLKHMYCACHVVGTQ